MMILATLGGFFAAWPLAFVYRFLNGRPSPSAAAKTDPWTIGDTLREAGHRLWTGRFLPWTPRRHVPWSFIDLVMIVLMALLVLLGASTILHEFGGPAAKGQGMQPPRMHLSAIADSAWKLVVMTLATVYLIFKARITWRDFGLSAGIFGRHLVIGIVTFVMIAPPVYAIQAAIVWFGKWKYEHPLIEMLQKSPDIGLFLVLAFSACVMAPLSEEWLFRGLLQGWLERAFGWLGSLLFPASVLRSLPPAASTDEGDAVAAGLAEAPLPALATAYGPVNPYLTPPLIAELAETHSAADGPEALEQPFPRSMLFHWPPMMFSAVLFGLAHWGHGPAPIPLTVLALALGYVYQRTHSIVPVIVVHALFNSLSMLLFYVYMFELKQPLP